MNKFFKKVLTVVALSSVLTSVASAAQDGIDPVISDTDTGVLNLDEGMLPPSNLVSGGLDMTSGLDINTLLLSAGQSVAVFGGDSGSAFADQVGTTSAIIDANANGGLCPGGCGGQQYSVDLSADNLSVSGAWGFSETAGGVATAETLNQSALSGSFDISQFQTIDFTTTAGGNQ